MNIKINRLIDKDQRNDSREVRGKFYRGESTE